MMQSDETISHLVMQAIEERCNQVEGALAGLLSSGVAAEEIKLCHEIHTCDDLIKVNGKVKYRFTTTIVNKDVET